MGMLQGQRLPIEPNHRLLFGETLFAVERPLAEAEIAQPVQPAGKATGEEDPMQMRWLPDMPNRLIQDFSGGALPIFALTMGPVGLLIMRRHPALMLDFCA